MPRQTIFTPKAAKPPVTYSQAVKAAGLIFVSGTAPQDPESGALVGTTIQEQTRQCLRNIAAILEFAGSSLDKVASVTVVLADEQDFQGMNEEWLKWFPSNPPARQGAKLPVKIPGSQGVDCSDCRGLTGSGEPVSGGRPRKAGNSGGAWWRISAAHLH
jgi:2-iminobutanoate/2-iminopropanoate deaminase